MAVAPASSTRLGCGRDVDQVWENLDHAPDAHELACPFCRAARTDLAGLARATRELRDVEAADPDGTPGPQVLERILTVARAEVRRGRRLPLDRTGVDEDSVSTVSEQAVTAVVRRAGDRDPRVQIRRCTLVVDPDPDPGPVPLGTVEGGGVPEPGPTAVRVSLRVSIGHGAPVVDVGARLRASVIEAVGREVGMDVVSVDIAVEDLHDA